MGAKHEEKGRIVYYGNIAHVKVGRKYRKIYCCIFKVGDRKTFNIGEGKRHREKR